MAALAVDSPAVELLGAEALEAEVLVAEVLVAEVLVLIMVLPGVQGEPPSSSPRAACRRRVEPPEGSPRQVQVTAAARTATTRCAKDETRSAA
ncbi:hypothetical protein [Pengzhenrongella phosphoraccumulans]|uniref:hypothetical protein n=1 Tax=Pengzhenrongella phosphoraccumulans TaxID=3114394 RepID=UPI00388EEA41